MFLSIVYIQYWLVVLERRIVVNTIIILLCLYSLYFIIGSTLAPIFSDFKMYALADKMRFLYANSCHQQPDRSFWILGYPIALCCRCYGVYFSTFIYGIFVVIRKIKLPWKIFFSIFSIDFIDIFLNLKIIDTSNIIRFLAGILIGILFIDVLYKLLNIKNGEEK